jgi:integrase
MRDLKVRFRQSRQCWVINATRVGLSNTHGGFRTKPEAEEEAEKLKAQFVLGQDVEAKAKPKLFSVRDALDDYQANQALLQTKSYFEAQKFNLGLLAAVKFKGIPVGKHQMERLGRKAEREDFRTCIQLAIKNEGKSVETMRTRRKHWSKFFKFAAGKGWIDANPIEDIQLPKPSKKDERAPKVQPGFIAWLQTDALDAHAVAFKKAAEKKFQHGQRNHLTISPAKLELMILLSITTGLRQGELRALRRCDYSPNRQIISIRGGIDHGTQMIGRAKTEEGQDRDIEVPPAVCAMLDDLLQKSRFQDFDDLIFPSTTGTPLRKNDFSEAIKPMRAVCPFKDEETGKPLHFLWADMRHAFASNMINQLGANWVDVSESMGHTNPEFTKRRYGHYIEDEEKSQRKRDAAGAVLVNRKGR